MDLMIDPACEINTWLETVKLGLACDEANFLWLEDPYKDTGISQHGHNQLKKIVKTPILQTEHIRGLEQHVDFIASGATDLVRVDPDYDSGITGGFKTVHAAEGFGLDVEIHSPGPAQRALMSANRNTNYYEMALLSPKTPEIGRCNAVYADDYRDATDEIDSNGHVNVPTGPCLGVTYDWDYIMKNRTGEREYS
jgi:L-alanine-DL-glutamate epimerase-like enolase superfamily enzyme